MSGIPGITSVRPARLIRFEGTMEATAEGLRRRAAALAAAIAVYEATCNDEFRAPTAGLSTAVRSLAEDLEGWGEWTGSVGRAALVADDFTTVPWDPNPGDDEATHRVAESWLKDQLGRDPFRGVAEGAAGVMADGLGVDYSQSGPPAWIDHLAAGGALAGIAQELLEAQIRVVEGLSVDHVIRYYARGGWLYVMQGQGAASVYSIVHMEARLRVPVEAPARLTTVAKGLGRLSTALGFGTGFIDQWHHDQDRSTHWRIARATGRGGTGLVGGVLGGAGGGLAASWVCGPGAPLCAAPFVIVGGFAGGFGADKLFTSLFNSDPKPGEHDLRALEDQIAADGDNPEILDELTASVEQFTQDLLALDPPPPPVALDVFGPVPRCLTPPPIPLGNLFDPSFSWERPTLDPNVGPTRERAEALFGSP